MQLVWKPDLHSLTSGVINSLPLHATRTLSGIRLRRQVSTQNGIDAIRYDDIKHSALAERSVLVNSAVQSSSERRLYSTKENFTMDKMLLTFTLAVLCTVVVGQTPGKSFSRPMYERDEFSS